MWQRTSVQESTAWKNLPSLIDEGKESLDNMRGHCDELLQVTQYSNRREII